GRRESPNKGLRVTLAESPFAVRSAPIRPLGFEREPAIVCSSLQLSDIATEPIDISLPQPRHRSHMNQTIAQRCPMLTGAFGLWCLRLRDAKPWRRLVPAFAHRSMFGSVRVGQMQPESRKQPENPEAEAPEFLSDILRNLSGRQSPA